MNKLVMGVLAHVDAGKTTLSEALLYQSGAIRRLGRVDHRDAFLDTEELERERGITMRSGSSRCWTARFWWSAGPTGSRPTPGPSGGCWSGTRCPRSSSSTRWTWRARTGGS